MRIKVKTRKRPCSRSIAENAFAPFVSLYDPDGEPVRTNGSFDDADVLPMRLGKCGLASYRRKRFARTTECVYCGVSFEDGSRTLDHVIPLSRGGLNHPSNLLVSCFHCNQRKADSTLPEWLERVQHKLDKLQRIRDRIAELIQEREFDENHG